MQSITISQAKRARRYQVGKACAALLAKDAAVSLMSSTSTEHVLSNSVWEKKSACDLFLTSSFLNFSFFFLLLQLFPEDLDLQITSLCLVSAGAVLLFRYAQKAFVFGLC